MNHDKKIFLNTSYQILGKIVTSALGIISTAILTRYLGKFDFGEFSLALTLVNFVVIFGDFGLGTLLTREIASGRKGKIYFLHVFSLRILLSLGVLLSTNVLMQFFPYSNLVKVGVLFASFGSFFLLLSSLYWSLFQAELRFEKIVFAQVATSITYIILVIFGTLLKLPLNSFILFTTISQVVGFVISLRLTGILMTCIRFNTTLVKEIVRNAWPFGLSLIVSTAYFKIDSLLLSYYFNPARFADFSYYTVAYKPFEVVTVFSGFFIQTLFPHFSSLVYSVNFFQNFKKYLTFSCIIAISSIGVVYFFAKPLILFLGGDSYIPSIASLQILSIATGVTFLSGFFTSLAIAAHKQHATLVIAILALSINVALNIVIIPRYSYIGASWTTVFTQSFIFVASACVVLRMMREKEMA